MSELTLLTPVITKLVNLLVEEASALKGVRKHIKSLKDELEIIEPFLRDAEAKSERGQSSGAAKVWLSQLREEAERIEDVVDEYTYHLEKHRIRSGFLGSLHKAGRLIKSLKPRQEIASEIRDIEESLKKIKDRGLSFGLRPLEQGSSSSSASNSVDPRIGSLFLDDDEVVRIKSISKDLVRNLVEGPSTRTLIALIGEGGIGKTTLAKKVYDDLAVKNRFDCRVWITVSQSYDLVTILKIMESQIGTTIEQSSGGIVTLEVLIEGLKKTLQTKRYVFVFDDVWQTDFWGFMKFVFPKDDKGSRIMITTRNAAVAESFKETRCDVDVMLKTWPEDLAWELFCKMTFLYEIESRCPIELEQLSRQIVSKCQGLPLVISLVAGVLSKKEKIELEWKRFLDNLDYEFKENKELSSISRSLQLSYHDLPYHLKLCFLYFGIFPEDFKILGKKSCRIWIAQDLIKARANKTMEETADEYLNELIKRNLVSFKIKRGHLIWCRVHT